MKAKKWWEEEGYDGSGWSNELNKAFLAEQEERYWWRWSRVGRGGSRHGPFPFTRRKRGREELWPRFATQFYAKTAPRIKGGGEEMVGGACGPRSSQHYCLCKCCSRTISCHHYLIRLLSRPRRPGCSTIYLPCLIFP